ncbi:hypothetical protein [Segetibacter sp.]|jgi:hypothetical protein|uniref:hypothetical protein n=1 Tax=Segetibacter sp. TaxID=2231182 RepID=UPI0026039B01|nr:hypothetical protein [Segetibacter sp.]MCW3079996.1 hypothetical protein [Segetibacter sp.]
MKKISVVCLAGLLFFTACENGGSSTVGSYEKEETSSSEKSESGSEGHGGQVKESKGHESTEHESAEHQTSQGATTDTTVPTSGGAREGALGAEIKTGANVRVDTTNMVKPRP